MPQLPGFVIVSYCVTVLSSCCTASLESLGKWLHLLIPSQFMFLCSFSGGSRFKGLGHVALSCRCLEVITFLI